MGFCFGFFEENHNTNKHIIIYGTMFPISVHIVAIQNFLATHLHLQEQQQQQDCSRQN